MNTMNPAIDKIAERNLERTFELLLADFLVMNPNFTPEIAKEFATRIVRMAERASIKALKSAFKRMDARVVDTIINDAINNPKVAQQSQIK